MIKEAKIISIEIKSEDNIEKILLTCEAEYGHNIQAVLYNPAGDYSIPQPDDFVSILKIPGAGNYIAIGNLNNISDIGEGEKYLYSRDSDGNIVASAYFQNDGKLDVKTDSNIIMNINDDTIILEMNDDGTVNIITDDEITIDGGGDVNIKSDSNVVFQEGTDYAVRYNELKTQLDQLKTDLGIFINIYNTHTHSGVQAGGSSTGNPSATGTNTTANFTNCKIDNINVPAVGE